MATTFPASFRTAFLSIAVGIAGMGALPSAATTQDDVVHADVLSGWETDDGTTMMAIRLRLAPGWKTYWRSPGDAGIPPSFDWRGSDNIASVRLHWPRPSVFQTNGVTSIGYHDELILPVEIRPERLGAPGRIALTLQIGVCLDICLPAELTLSAPLSGAGEGRDLIKAALADRPTSGDDAGLTSIACRVDPIADGLRVTADLQMPAQGKVETVVFESGLPGVWVSESMTERQGTRLRSVTEMVPLEGAPFALDRSGVTITVISQMHAVEIIGCPAAP